MWPRSIQVWDGSCSSIGKNLRFWFGYWKHTFDQGVFSGFEDLEWIFFGYISKGEPQKQLFGKSWDFVRIGLTPTRLPNVGIPKKGEEEKIILHFRLFQAYYLFLHEKVTFFW